MCVCAHVSVHVCVCVCVCVCMCVSKLTTHAVISLILDMQFVGEYVNHVTCQGRRTLVRVCPQLS